MTQGSKYKLVIWHNFYWTISVIMDPTFSEQGAMWSPKEGEQVQENLKSTIPSCTGKILEDRKGSQMNV